MSKERYQKIVNLDRKDLTCSTLIAVQSLLGEFPDHGAAWVRCGINLNRLSRYREARFAFRQAKKNSPKSVRHIIYVNVGESYKNRGKYRRAEVWFRKAITAQPTHTIGYIYLGGLQAKRGNLVAAEEIHRQATLCVEGCVDEAFFNLGLVLRAQERFVEALECFQEALRRDPQYKAAKLELSDVSNVLFMLQATA